MATFEDHGLLGMKPVTALQVQKIDNLVRPDRNEQERRMNKPLDVALDIAPDDTRPKHGAWAPGKYMCKCYNCDRTFFGDKRALSCAECAYNNGWRLMDSAPKDGREFLAVNKDKASVSYRVVYFDEDATDKLYPWHVEDAGKGFNHHRDFFTHWKRLPEPPPAAAG